MPNLLINQLPRSTSVALTSTIVVSKLNNVLVEANVHSIRNDGLFHQFPSNKAIKTSTQLLSAGQTSKWFGGVLGSDGKIYGIPYNQTDILIIDPLTNTASRSLMGMKFVERNQTAGFAADVTWNTSLSGINKWCGGILAPNGKIYAIPYNATDFLIIDPANNTATRSKLGMDSNITSSLTLSGAAKWAGGVLAPDGKIYGIPFDSPDILIIDPLNNTATRTNMTATLTDAGKWVGGALSQNGRIYAIPWNSTDVLIIDYANLSATRNTMGAVFTGLTKWAGGISHPNGFIYGMPFGAQGTLSINPYTNTAVISAIGSAKVDLNKYFGGTLAFNGNIYSLPHLAPTVLNVAPTINTEVRSAMGATIDNSVSKYIGSVLAPNGKIYGIPHDAADVLVVDPELIPTRSYSREVIMSAYNNHF